MRITERRLRSIIRSVIKESTQSDLSSPEDMEYLSSMGIDSLDDAMAYAMNESDHLANESINRLMFRVIKESSGDKQKIINAANMINNQIKDGSEENCKKAASVLEQLIGEKNSYKRIKIVGRALSILGVSMTLAPLVLFIIAMQPFAPDAAMFSMEMLSQLGAFGITLGFSFGYAMGHAGMDMLDRPYIYRK